MIYGVDAHTGQSLRPAKADDEEGALAGLQIPLRSRGAVPLVPSAASSQLIDGATAVISSGRLVSQWSAVLGVDASCNHSGTTGHCLKSPNYSKQTPLPIHDNLVVPTSADFPAGSRYVMRTVRPTRLKNGDHALASPPNKRHRVPQKTANNVLKTDETVCKPAKPLHNATACPEGQRPTQRQRGDICTPFKCNDGYKNIGGSSPFTCEIGEARPGRSPVAFGG
jgi:hypothetical protein